MESGVRVDSLASHPVRAKSPWNVRTSAPAGAGAGAAAGAPAPIAASRNTPAHMVCHSDPKLRARIADRVVIEHLRMRGGMGPAAGNIRTNDAAPSGDV